MHHCAVCQKSFSRKQHYDRHLNSSHHELRMNSIETLHKCNNCGKSFSFLNGVYKHKKMCKPIEVQSPTESREVVQETEEHPPNEIAELREEIAVLREEIAQLRSKSASQRVSSSRRKWKPVEREQIAIKQDNKCNRCKATLSMYFHIDHKTALQYGGLDDTENLQALCYECHIQKSILENRARDRIQDAIHVILNEEATLHHS
jgi:5-methylcytosine-specific restriction endonuclease McrA